MKHDHQTPINWLIAHIERTPEIKTVCEVGVWKCETLCRYAPIIKERGGLIYAVDWFQGNEHEVYQGPQAKQVHYYREDPTDEIYNDFCDNLEEIDCDDIVVVCRGISHIIAECIPDESLDLCFLDADHTFDGVKKDISAFLPKVKPGGMLCGHDYNQNAVREAVNQTFKKVTTADDPTGKIWIKQ